MAKVGQQGKQKVGLHQLWLLVFGVNEINSEVAIILSFSSSKRQNFDFSHFLFRATAAVVLCDKNCQTNKGHQGYKQNVEDRTEEHNSSVLNRCPV